MDLDIEAIRAQTPGCASVNHLNSAGSSLPPSTVVDAVVEYIQTEARIGGYEIVEERTDALESVYAAAATLFGGNAENWAFVESATRAWNAGFSALRFAPGDRVLTTQAEYPSNMGGLLRAREIQGVEVVVVPDDDDGQVDLAALESLLDDRTRLVSLVHVPTHGGLINPALQVGSMLRDTPILYQLDACQSVGQLPVDVDELGCDILSFTGRKFLRGPRGTGMIWASDRALDQMGNPAGVDMQGSTWESPMTMTPLPSARRFEPYEVFFAGKVGLAVALDYAAMIGIDAIATRNSELSSRLRSGLGDLPGVKLHDKGVEKSAIVTFTVDKHDSGDVQKLLRTKAINVSRSFRASARLDFPERNLDQVVRASVHYFNTVAEIDALVEVIADLSRSQPGPGAR